MVVWAAGSRGSLPDVVLVGTLVGFSSPRNLLLCFIVAAHDEACTQSCFPHHRQRRWDHRSDRIAAPTFTGCWVNASAASSHAQQHTPRRSRLRGNLWGGGEGGESKVNRKEHEEIKSTQNYLLWGWNRSFFNYGYFLGPRSIQLGMRTT